MKGRIRAVKLMGKVLVSLVLMQALPLVASELDENCVVSLLNRTVQVAEDGGWSLPNVSASQGSVRAFVSCLRDDGSVESGQSDYFAVVANGITPVPEFNFGDQDPIPASLAFSTTQPLIINEVGVTSQLLLTATYSDTATVDVTQSNGVNYFSTNPAVATVDEDGLVASLASGFTLISALKDGVIAARNIIIDNGGDLDGDGLPDYYELANGLNVNDPVDAFEDQDKDGLSALDEFFAGTDIYAADTDGDGVDDGEELVLGNDGYVSNPLLWDTDGDGLSDGVEVAVGSDPNDPGDTNMEAALLSLSITPENFEVVRNTIDNETFAKVTVTGQLIDGSEVDLTSNAGVSYESTDLTVVGFGLEKGELLVSKAGSAIVTARLGAFIGSTDVTVTDFSPRALGYLALPDTGFSNNVDIAGDYAYIAAGADGLYIIDTSDKTQPILVATLALSGNGNDVKVVPGSELIVIAGGSAGVHLVDVSIPHSPQLISSVDTPGTAIDLAIENDIVYLADGDDGVQVIDISGETPVIVSTINTNGHAYGVAVSDNVLAAANRYSSSIQVVELSNGTNELLSLEVSLASGSLSQVSDLLIRDDDVFIVTNNGLFSVDISDLAFPSISAQSGDSIFMTNLAWLDEKLVTTWVEPTTKMSIWDIQFPHVPGYRGEIVFSQINYFFGDGTGLSLDSQYAYMVASRKETISKGGVSGGSTFYIGQYDFIGDEGTVAPTVTITSPSDGASSYIEGQSVLIEVDATDDVRVVSVDFLVDDVLVGTDALWPYEFAVVATMGSSALQARATDLAGNIGYSSIVTVFASADTSAPTIELTSPLESETYMLGGIVPFSVESADNVGVDRVDFLVNGTVVFSDQTVPFEYEYVPDFVGTILVEAVAYDGSGNEGYAQSVSVSAILEFELTSPLENETFVPGDTVLFSPEIVNNTGVARVDFLVNGTVVFSDQAVPFEYEYVPDFAGTKMVEAVAYDKYGNEGAAQPVFISVIEDPGTTVVGFVTGLDNIALQGATVLCRGVESLSDMEGNFVVANVPSYGTELFCEATYIAGAESLEGKSWSSNIVRGGTTDVDGIRVGLLSVLVLVSDLQGGDELLFQDLFADIPDTIEFHYAGFSSGLDVPTLESLIEFDVIWLINFGFHVSYFWGPDWPALLPPGLPVYVASDANTKAMGDVLFDYVQTGGGLVIAGGGYAIVRSNSPFESAMGWGALESIDLFESLAPECGLHTKIGLLTEHALTRGLEGYESPAFGSCFSNKGESTTVAAQSANGAPLIGYRVLPDGQRIVAIDAYPFEAIFADDPEIGWPFDPEGFYLMWENALLWVAQ